MSYRRLGRNSGARKALFKSLLAALFKYERIETTEAKAKELRKFAEKVVTLAKRGDLSARRQAIQMVDDVEVVHKVFEELPQKFSDREGGYTRILKLGPRRGDAAPMVLIELVD
ncbi:MAG: 50S ribosomal protein L17 [Selenomonadaceae bacterium]|nr:50S ribosomal protein L17 [Selenomonadaceae bacterium]